MEQLRIAYVLFVFPVLSETTIVNELLAARELGASVKILSWETPAHKMDHVITTVQHAVTDSLMDDVVYLQATRQPRREILKASVLLLLRRGLGPYREAYALARDYGLLANWKSFMRFAYWAYWIQAQGISHIHAHFATEAAAVALVLSRLAGLPYSFTAHAHDVFWTPQRLDEKMKAARFVVTVCESNKGYLLQTYPEIQADKIHVIHPGVDLNRFTPRPPDSTGRFRIVSVGRLVETKGHFDLVEACHLLQRRQVDFECAIVGEGPCRTQLQEAIRAWGLADHIALLGALPHERLMPVLDAADVFVLPCFVGEDGNRDAMPLVLAEAMAKEIPVISTPVSGIPELVRDSAGCLVSPRDPEQLATMIEWIYNQGDEGRREMGQRGRLIVESEFSLRVEVTKLLGLIEQCPT